MSTTQTVNDIIQTLITVSVSLGTGLLGSWLFLIPKIDQRDKYIEELEKFTKKHAKQLKDKNQSRAQKGVMINQATVKKSELSDRPEELISEKNSHLETLNHALKNQEQNILELTKRAQEIESIARALAHAPISKNKSRK
jgi:hypothetical protein